MNMRTLLSIFAAALFLTGAFTACDIFYGPAMEGQDAPAFSPKDLPGLIYWFSADQGVTAASGSVSLWQNLAGNGLNASQSTFDNQPALVAGVLNGKPVLRFSGIQYLVYDGSRYVGSSYTIFIVQRIPSGVPTVPIGGQAETVGDNLFIGYFSTDPCYQLNHDHYGTMMFECVPFNANGELIAALLDANVRRSTYHNGALAITSTDSTGNNYVAPVASYPNSTIGLLYSGSPNQSFFLGDIAEYVAYNRALPDNERRAVESYLNSRYRLW